MGFPKYDHDPQARLDYLIDWAPWLAEDDTITSSDWIAETGVVIDDDSEFTDTTATVWLTGGTAGDKYIVTNHIVTAQGRADDRSILIDCKER